MITVKLFPLRLPSLSRSRCRHGWPWRLMPPWGNRLPVEAIRLVDAVEKKPSAEAKIDLLRRAHDSLTMIVERDSSADPAVKPASGQHMGKGCERLSGSFGLAVPVWRMSAPSFRL